jgi:hypothetical protein
MKRKIIFLIILLDIFCVFAYARKEFEIQGSVAYFDDQMKKTYAVTSDVYITLIRMSDKVIVYRLKPLDYDYSNGYFHFFVKKGRYILCISGDLTYNTAYMSINLTSNINTGTIILKKTPPDLIVNQPLIESFPLKDTAGYSLEKKKNNIINTANFHIRQSNVLQMLRQMNIDRFEYIDSRNKKEKFAAKIKINGVLIKKDLQELIKYLEQMPATNVQQVEWIPSSMICRKPIIKIIETSKTIL